jgi:hypothetical protein
VVISDYPVVVCSTTSLAVFDRNCAEVTPVKSNPAGKTTLTNNPPTYAPTNLKFSTDNLPIPAKYLFVHLPVNPNALSWVLATSTVPFPYSSNPLAVRYLKLMVSF